MIQLWVNLPKKDKMTKPRYQSLRNTEIPQVQLPNGAGVLRLIAGQYGDTSGPAKTFSPINLWDLRLNSGADVELKVPSGHTAMVFIMSGDVKVAEAQTIGEAEIAILDPQGDTVKLTASTDAKLMFLGGAPLNEPFVGHGPFVMSNRAEISQAIQDFNAGKMGTLDSIEGSEVTRHE